MRQALVEFEEILNSVPRRLGDLSDEAVSAKPDPATWSKKEILGHLIDSAANNHQRFVRAQRSNPFEGPGYEQEFWVASQNYQKESWPDMVNLWLLYNRHLLHVLKAMPSEVLPHECRIGSYPVMTLEEVAVDYVRHMQGHLDELFG